MGNTVTNSRDDMPFALDDEDDSGVFSSVPGTSSITEDQVEDDSGVFSSAPPPTSNPEIATPRTHPGHQARPQAHTPQQPMPRPQGPTNVSGGYPSINQSPHHSGQYNTVNHQPGVPPHASANTPPPQFNVNDQRPVTGGYPSVRPTRARLTLLGETDNPLGEFEITGGRFLLGRKHADLPIDCLLYTSPSPRDRTRSRMPSSA